MARADAPEFVPGQVIVKLRAPGDVMQRAKQRLDLRLGVGRAAVMGLVGVQLATRAALVRIADGDTLAAVRRLAADPEVEWAEPNYIRRITAVTVNDPAAPRQWALQKAHIVDAWSQTTGDPSTVVAVIDSGITMHPDLAGRLLPGYDFISDPSNADDGDGRDADPTDTGSEAPGSSELHGTHVSGIIAAATNNGIGVAGIDWKCKVVPVRALGVKRGTGNDVDITDAMRWAGGLPVAGVPDNPNPAKIINLSFGGPGVSHLVDETATALRARGIIIIAAAGNDNVDAATYSPGSAAAVITVGATRYDGTRAPYSNHGAKLTVMAPGGDLAVDQDGDGNPDGIYSTVYSKTTMSYGYTYLQGTSQAAPEVTGIVALMLAVDPTLSPVRADRILRDSADPTSQCAEGCGGGLVDAAAALTMTQSLIGMPDPPDPAITSTAGGPGAPLYGGCSAGGPAGGAASWLGLLVMAAFLARALARRS